VPTSAVLDGQYVAAVTDSAIEISRIQFDGRSFSEVCLVIPHDATQEKIRCISWVSRSDVTAIDTALDVHLCVALHPNRIMIVTVNLLQGNYVVLPVHQISSVSSIINIIPIWDERLKAKLCVVVLTNAGTLRLMWENNAKDTTNSQIHEVDLSIPKPLHGLFSKVLSQLVIQCKSGDYVIMFDVVHKITNRKTFLTSSDKSHALHSASPHGICDLNYDPLSLHFCSSELSRKKSGTTVDKSIVTVPSDEFIAGKQSLFNMIPKASKPIISIISSEDDEPISSIETETNDNNVNEKRGRGSFPHILPGATIWDALRVPLHDDKEGKHFILNCNQ
jgi:hypothetical protein